MFSLRVTPKNAKKVPVFQGLPWSGEKIVKTMRNYIENYQGREKVWNPEPTSNGRTTASKGPGPYRVEDPLVFHCCPPEPIRKESASHHVCVLLKHILNARRFCDFRLRGRRYQGQNLKFSLRHPSKRKGGVRSTLLLLKKKTMNEKCQTYHGL